MSLLQQISSEPPVQGMRIVLAGIEKIGKTTLACDAPAPLLIPMEVGYGGVNVSKVPLIQDYKTVMDLLTEILSYAYAGQFPYQTIVIDSATALERAVHEAVLKLDPGYVAGNTKAVTMESALGGYGRAYTYANERFDAFLKLCDQLCVHGKLNVVLTCHVFAAKVVDPASGEYDSWDLLLHSPKNQKTYGKREMITQWADVVGFLHEPMYVTKDGNMSKGVSSNQGRVLGLSRTPAYVAGNRYGCEGSVSIPKDGGWNYLADALYKSKGIDIFKR